MQGILVWAIPRGPSEAPGPTGTAHGQAIGLSLRDALSEADFRPGGPGASSQDSSTQCSRGLWKPGQGPGGGRGESSAWPGKGFPGRWAKTMDSRAARGLVVQGLGPGWASGTCRGSLGLQGRGASLAPDSRWEPLCSAL